MENTHTHTHASISRQRGSDTTKRLNRNHHLEPLHDVRSERLAPVSLQARPKVREGVLLPLRVRGRHVHVRRLGRILVLRDGGISGRWGRGRQRFLPG